MSMEERRQKVQRLVKWIWTRVKVKKCIFYVIKKFFLTLFWSRSLGKWQKQWLAWVCVALVFLNVSTFFSVLLSCTLKILKNIPFVWIPILWIWLLYCVHNWSLALEPWDRERGLGMELKDSFVLIIHNLIKNSMEEGRFKLVLD